MLKTLTSQAPAGVCVGVGTVMDDTVCHLEEVKQLGGRFALSPINPTGFIPECHRLGLLAVPAGEEHSRLVGGVLLCVYAVYPFIFHPRTLWVYT